ncbi:cupin domain-containing protein [Haloferax namakaokahaiae]|uniref:Cupin domain-containing protein n=1 Tax=Haloferax namakaokahaiae TaxID=1748331 RepID=A0ABD5ZA09_9EURY
MKKVALNDVDSASLGEESARRSLSDPLGTTNVALNHYRIAPGDGLPGGLHAHMDQEEVFVVVAGEATFETMAGEITVGEGEAVRFEPGEFQSGANRSDTELSVFALGAPRDTNDTRIPATCPNCSHDTLRLEVGEESLQFVCPDCAAAFTPSDCPECGHADLRITLGETTATVVVCQNCVGQFETPPLRD